MVVRLRPLHPVRRIVRDGVALAQIVEQRRQRSQLAADGGRRQASGFQVLAPGDQVGTGDGAELLRAGDPDEGGKVAHVLLVGPPGAGIGQVGEPFQFRRHFGQALEFGGGQGAARPGPAGMIVSRSVGYIFLPYHAGPVQPT